MNKPIDVKPVVLGITRKTLEGRQIFACPHCRAPGVFSAHESIQTGWPGCYDPDRAQQPVGEICPNCQGQRSPDKDHGKLASNIPAWLWKSILFVKRCLIALKKLKGQMT